MSARQLAEMWDAAAERGPENVEWRMVNEHRWHELDEVAPYLETNFEWRIKPKPPAMCEVSGRFPKPLDDIAGNLFYVLIRHGRAGRTGGKKQQVFYHPTREAAEQHYNALVNIKEVQS